MLQLTTKWRRWRKPPLWSPGKNHWLPSLVCQSITVVELIHVRVCSYTNQWVMSSSAQAIASSTRRQWKAKARSWLCLIRQHLWPSVTFDLESCTTSVSMLWKTVWRVSPSLYRSTQLEIHCQVNNCSGRELLHGKPSPHFSFYSYSDLLLQIIMWPL